MLPREPTEETENVFERKKALKRNVATRQPARFVRHGFAEQLWFSLKANVHITDSEFVVLIN